MTPLFKKLNLKEQVSITVLNAPKSFEDETAKLSGVSVKSGIESGTTFVIGFAITKAELDEISNAAGPALKGDSILWIAYPKGTSKRYKCEFNRDKGFDVIGGFGFEPVRQVAIDEDWSAVRFRRTSFIKDIKRSDKMTISKEGKARTMTGKKN